VANKKLNNYPKTWLILFSVVYLCFLVLSLFWPNSLVVSILKVGSIFLCFLYSLIFNKQDKLLIAAMATTFIADVILAYNNVAISGVIVFVLAQTFHFVRLSQKLLRNLICYSAIVIVLIIVALIRRADIMYVIGGIYALMLLSNLFMSFRWFLESKSSAAKRAFFGFFPSFSPNARILDDVLESLRSDTANTTVYL